MGRTKIINVQKSDTYEDVADLVQQTNAGEVIMILPKGSKFSKKPSYFDKLGQDSQELGKTISIMSDDPVIAQLAAEQGFSMLAIKKTKPKATLAADVELDSDDDEDDDDAEETFDLDPELDEDDDEIEEEEEEVEEEHDEPEAQGAQSQQDYIATLAATTKPAKKKTTKRVVKRKVRKTTATASKKPIMRDIVTAQAPSEVPIDRDLIEQDHEQEQEIEIAAQDQVNEDTPVSNEPISQEPQAPIEPVQAAPPANPDPEPEPEPKNNVNVDIAKLWSEEERIQKTAAKRPSISFKRVFSRTPLIITGVAIVILAVILVAVLGSARVVVTPAQQELNFNVAVSASSRVDTIDAQFNRIPGQLYESTQTITTTFPTTGEKEVTQKARGDITIFNKTSAEQPLVATTRFESSDGKIFRIPQSVTVPAGTGSGDSFEEGSITVTVFADAPGEQYNIEPGQFTIPGFEGNEKFDQFYATSAQPMSGGIIGNAQVVTQQDFADAITQTTEEARAAVLAELKNQSGELTVLDVVDVTINDPVTNVDVGEATDELEVSITGTAQVMAFRQEDLFMLIESYVEQNGELMILPTSVIFTYADPELTDENQVMEFDVQVSGTAASAIVVDTIKQDILGMSEQAVVDYFNARDDIGPVRIMLSPFWVRSIPNDSEKVTVINDFVEPDAQ